MTGYFFGLTWTTILKKQTVEQNGLPSVKYISTIKTIATLFWGDYVASLTGLSTQPYIQCIIEKSQKKNYQTNLSVSEIAYELGLWAFTSFGQTFLRQDDVSAFVWSSTSFKLNRERKPLLKALATNTGWRYRVWRYAQVRFQFIFSANFGWRSLISHKRNLDRYAFFIIRKHMGNNFRHFNTPGFW